MIRRAVEQSLAAIGSLGARRLAYFACSVVWRGHAARCLPKCDLGPLGEVFRRFVNGDRDLPNTVQVSLSLLANDRPTKADLGELITMPLSIRKRPYHSHEFALCGMYFAVRTGASRSEVEHAMMSETPIVALASWDVYKEWFGPELVSARFIGRRPPLGSKGKRVGE